MKALPRIAVLASGRGSNLAALIDARDRGALPAQLVLVGSDRADAGALRLAADAGIDRFHLRPRDYATRRAFDEALFTHLAEARADLLVLAGFMRILDGDVLAPWVGRMINIHPSLLPKYRGLHTHRRGLDAGDAEHGASVHFVTAELDGGPVIAQARLAIRSDEDEHALAMRLLPLEHRLLPAALALLTDGRVQLRGGQVWLDGRPLDAPLRMNADGALARA